MCGMVSNAVIGAPPAAVLRAVDECSAFNLALSVARNGVAARAAVHAFGRIGGEPIAVRATSDVMRAQAKAVVEVVPQRGHLDRPHNFGGTPVIGNAPQNPLICSA
jgi:hypothetical protein